MKTYLLFLFFLIVYPSYGMDEYRAEEKILLLRSPESQDISAQELNTFPEIHLQRQKIIENRNAQTGMYTDPHYTLADQSRLSVGYSLSQDYRNPGKVQAISGSYLSKMDDFYQELWWALQVKRTQAQFVAVHDESTTKDTELQSFTTLGIGVAHSFNALSDLLESDRFFEALIVCFNYNFHLDSTDDERYRGYGYNAEYNLSYRTNESFFYGGSFSYNWAQVEKPAENDEPLLARSFSFGWTTLGVEIGFYF